MIPHYQAVLPEYSTNIITCYQQRACSRTLWIFEPDSTILFYQNHSILITIEDVIGPVLAQIGPIIGQDHNWMVRHLISDHWQCAEFVAVAKRMNIEIPMNFTVLVHLDQ